jgi:Protein of unknown function (DUF3148)
MSTDSSPNPSTDPSTDPSIDPSADPIPAISPCGDRSTEFPIGAIVRLTVLPAYVKTAEVKPMLRPPNVLQVGEEGVVLQRYPANNWGIRFSKGAFLLDCNYLELVRPPEALEPSGLSTS